MNGLGSDTTDVKHGISHRGYVRSEMFHSWPVVQDRPPAGGKNGVKLRPPPFTANPPSLENNAGRVYPCKPEMLKLHISLSCSFHFSWFTVWFGVGAGHIWEKIMFLS